MIYVMWMGEVHEFPGVEIHPFLLDEVPPTRMFPVPTRGGHWNVPVGRIFRTREAAEVAALDEQLSRP